MKKAIIAILLVLSGCAQAYAFECKLCGVSLNKHLTWESVGKMAIGAISSIIVHEAGHLITMEITGADYHWETLFSSECSGVSPAEARWIARNGFLFQHGVNLALLKWKPETDFTVGYTVTTSLVTLTYPLRHDGDGDFDMIDRCGGSGDAEWALFGGLAVRNLFVVEW